MKKIGFDCPFCHMENFDFLSSKNNLLIKNELKDGYICKGCGIRIPETLIISFIDDYNYKFV